MDIAELQKKLDDTVGGFKKENDKLLEEVKAGRTGLAEQSQKVEKMNLEITRLGDELKQAAAALKRVGTSGASGKDGEQSEMQKKHRELFKKAARGDMQALSEITEVSKKSYEEKAMTVDSDPNGGFFVTPDLNGRIVEQVYESSPIRDVAAVQAISSDALEGAYDLDLASSGWVSERGTRSTTNTPKVGRWRIPVHELYAEPQISQKLLDDANMDIEMWLSGKVSQRFARDEASGFVNGSGVGQPRGFLTYAAGDGSTSDLPYNGNSGRIQQIGSGSAGVVVADKLFDTVYALKVPYRKGAVWGWPRLLIAQLRKLKDSQNRYLWEPSLQAGEPGTLLGFPVIEMDDLPAAASNSLSGVFGNFREGYQIVDRIGIRVLRDPYTVKGQILLYTTKRVGGDVVNFEAIKIHKLG